MLNSRKQSILKSKDDWNDKLKKYRNLSSQLIPIISLVPYYDLLAIPLPCFKVDKTNKETFIILNDYKKTEIKIKEFYYSSNFLGVILEKIEYKKLN